MENIGFYPNVPLLLAVIEMKQFGISMKMKYDVELDVNQRHVKLWVNVFNIGAPAKLRLQPSSIL